MIVHADILDWATSYDGPLFHALLCDPPYHLTEVVKRFGKPNAAPATGDVYHRTAKGFMGKTWDGGDIAFRPETWATIAQVLHPGAFGMAFAGSRGWHRLACAIEDAGLLIHPTIFCWGYGSGFPKATRIDTQVDRRAGVERTKVGTKKHQPKFAAAELGYREKDNGYNSKARQTFDITAPATDLAHAWAGHRYGGQALKPAVEPIIVFQKPYEGRPVECITRTGAGALWIDGGRINPGETVPGGGRSWGSGDGTHEGWKRPGNQNYDPADSHTAGRWPANLILSHHPACNGACHPDCAVRRLGEQSGESDSTTHQRGEAWGYSGLTQPASVRGPADSGTTARFFFQADYMAERLEAADAVIYEAKADRSEREAGLDPRQVRLMNMSELNEQESSSIYGNETDEGAARDGRRPRHGFEEATINDGRAKSIDNPYQRGQTTRRNTHPTIKPIALARHLATLLLPPDRYAPRRILIPFAGAGSECIGALLAGWEDIVGVELEADHVAIAEARLAYWHQRRHEFTDLSKPIAASLSDAPAGQLDLFGDTP